MNSQPKEIITHILSYLDNRELNLARGTCTLWKNLIENLFSKTGIPPLHMCILNRDYYHFRKHYWDHVPELNKSTKKHNYYANFINLIGDKYFKESMIFRSYHWRFMEKENLLVYGAGEGHLDIIKYLIHIGTNLHFSRELALIKTIKYNQIDVMKYLIVNGTDIHYKNEYALQNSVMYGRLDIFKYLIDKGANIHMHNDYIWKNSAKLGRLEMIKFLLEKGIDIHAENDYALWTAAKNNYLDVVKYLVDHGANIHADKNRVLNDSAKRGNLDVVKFLIQHGAHCGIALRSCASQGHLEVVKYLIDNGADIHINNDDALQVSIGNLEVVKYLIEHGADIRANHDEILRFCIKWKKSEVVKYLISQYTDPTILLNLLCEIVTYD